MRKKSTFVLLSTSLLLGSCGQLHAITEEEALQRLNSFEESLNKKEMPKKYTVKTAYNGSYTYDKNTILENAQSTLLFDKEKSFYQYHVEGEKNGSRFFSEKYIVVRNDAELWELRWESGDDPSQTKTRRELKGSSFDDYLVATTTSMQVFFKNGAYLAKSFIESDLSPWTSSYGSLTEATYRCQGDDDLSIALTYTDEEKENKFSFSFENQELKTYGTNDGLSTYFWNECDAIAPQFKDYTLVE